MTVLLQLALHTEQFVHEVLELLVEGEVVAVSDFRVVALQPPVQVLLVQQFQVLGYLPSLLLQLHILDVHLPQDVVQRLELLLEPTLVPFDLLEVLSREVGEVGEVVVVE